jgi:hypothetical protein
LKPKLKIGCGTAPDNLVSTICYNRWRKLQIKKKVAGPLISQPR